MGRVVFGNSFEQDKWVRVDSLLQNIRADRGSDLATVPFVRRRSDAVARFSDNQTFSDALTLSHQISIVSKLARLAIPL